MVKEVYIIGLVLREARNGVVYFTDPGFFPRESGATFAFSTRLGGVSKPPFNSLNLSYSTGDDRIDVLKNRIKFLEGIGASVFNGVIGGQVHGNHVELINKEDFSKNLEMLLPDSYLPKTDGFITSFKNLPLGGTFADCVPLFFFEEYNKVIAVAHAGWKGTRLNIAKETIEKMKLLQSNFKLENLKVVIGPSIGSCCYEVGKEVYDEFEKHPFQEEIFSKKSKYSYYLDLWRGNFLQLTGCGVRPEKILVSEICTSCNSELFFSHRKEKGITGRMMGVIMLI